MSTPYTPLPWTLDDHAMRIMAMRDGEPVTVATGVLASDARYIVQAANMHRRLIAVAFRIRGLLVELGHDEVAELRLELIRLFNTLLLKTEGDQS